MKHLTHEDFERVAGNGLLHRRHLLAGALAMLPAAAFGEALLPKTPTMLVPGAPLRGYGEPSPHESAVQRLIVAEEPVLAPGTGASLTPLHQLQGIITPNGLHFERLHNGVPDIDPAGHRLLIHGMVRRPLVFTRETLQRYPLQSRIAFVECSGNSGANAGPKAQALTAGQIHGLVSCAEWTGVPLAILLDEVGIEAGASWLLAESADAAGMSRSLPVAKGMDDAMIALYQNGEAIRPEQGYPMRLLLPGWEGNMNVKWLRRIKVTNGPTYTKDETSKYTDLLADGRARAFTFVMETKSVITHPSGGMALPGPGLYQISGIAWSGSGRIRKVEISVDGGKSWAEAQLSDPVLPKALTRFRLPWHWNGGPAILQSRATDETGEVQPTRAVWKARYHEAQSYHMSAIQSWSVTGGGEVSNVFV